VAFASDPDVDRLAILDEHGNPLGEEKTLCLAAEFMLSRQPGPLVANVSSTMALDDLAQKYHVDIYRTPVGEIHVAKRMREVGAVIGGEGNGGVILPDLHLGRDALAGIALVLQLLEERGEPMSRLAAGIPSYHMVKTKIPLPETGVDLEKLTARLQEKFPGGRLDGQDGIKLLLPHAWLQIRRSTRNPFCAFSPRRRQPPPPGNWWNRLPPWWARSVRCIWLGCWEKWFPRSRIRNSTDGNCC
jgi:phosphomannomutase